MTPAGRAGWGVLALVVGCALFVGGREGGSPTDAQRAHRIAATVRCPTCRSQSAADSDAPAAVAVRDEIARRVAEGQSDSQIRSFLASRYTDDILLTPPTTGVSALVWVLPVLGVGVAALGLGLAFGRWRPRRRPVSDEDRALVEDALRPARPEGGGGWPRA